MSDERVERVVGAAMSAQGRAYVPYCRFPVGAAVMTTDGHVFVGANVDNASTGLGMCAERSAIFSMVGSLGYREIVLVAIVTRDGSLPCGACRQVVREFASEGATVVVADSGGKVRRFRFADLLPHSFGPEDMADGIAWA